MHVKITSFGGIFPAFKPRTLPADAAQTNRNLLASVPDFRPLATDLNVAVSGVNNPLTLYRLDRKADGTFNTDMTTGWVVNAATVSYAKGPLNDDSTERTYYTFDDGSAPPRWLDVNGVDRALGVPKPAAAPTATVIDADEFTPEDRAAGIDSALQQVVTHIRDQLDAAWVGATEPGVAGTSGVTGYLNLQTPGYGSPASQGKQARLWGLTSYDGARNGDIFTSYGGAGGTSGHSWAYDPAMQPFWIPADGSAPAWTYAGSPPGSYRDNVAVSFTAYGLTYAVDSASLNTALAAIPMPGKTDGTKLLTAGQIENGTDGLIDRLERKLSLTDNPEIKAKKAELAQAVDELRTIMNRGVYGAIEAQNTAYFAGATITTYMATEIETWANRVFDAAARSIQSTTPIGDYGGGGGDV